MAIVIVHEDTTISALTKRILKASTSKAATARALAAIREANPGVDLEALRPGMVLMIPSLPGARSSIGDIVDPSVNDVVDLVSERVSALADAAADAAAADRLGREEISEVFSSSEVERHAGRNPILKANLVSLKTELGAEEQAAAEQEAARNDAMAGWSDDLNRLRRLIE